MPLDPSIALQYKPFQVEPQTNALARILQLQGAQQQNALTAGQLQDQQTTRDEMGRIRNALAGLDPTADLSTQAKALRSTGTLTGLSKANELTKADIEQRSQLSTIGLNNAKTAQETATTAHQAVVRTLQTMPAQYDPQALTAWYQDAIANKVPGVTMQTAQANLQALAANPGKFQDWRNAQQMGGVELAKQIELRMPKYDWKDTGGSILPIQTNPMGGAVGVAPNLASLPKTMTPGETASNNLGWFSANKPTVTPTDQGVVLTNPHTGQSAYSTVGNPFAGGGGGAPVQPPQAAPQVAPQGVPQAIPQGVPRGMPQGAPQVAPQGVPTAPLAGQPSAPGQRIGAKDYYTPEATKLAATYGDNLNQRVQTGQDLMMRINEARTALDQFKPGMGAETRLTVARAAQAAGLPDSIVQRINQGDIAAKQEFMKLSAQQAMESLKQALGGSGRITQAEFKVFQQNNPNLELDPNAIKKIYDFSTRVYQRDLAEQQSRVQFLKGGGRPEDWQPTWAARMDPNGTGQVQSPGAQANAATTGAGAKLVRISSDADYAALPSGATYVDPDGKTRRKR